MASDRCSCYGRCHHDKVAPFEMTVQCETDTLSQSDRVIRHAVNDLQRAVEEGHFEVETPRVHIEQDDLRSFSIGWGRDKRFVRAHTCSPGPMQLELEFETAIENETLYRDIERDMQSVEPKVVLYGDMHVWYCETPHHDIAVEVTIGDADGVPPMALTADLNWLDVEPAGWR